MVTVDIAGRSDRGTDRESNQDQFLVARLHRSLVVEQTSLGLEDRTSLGSDQEGHLLVVADGMGGRPEGHKASALAVRTLMRYVLHLMPWYLSLDPRHEDDLVEDLERAIRRSEDMVRRHSEHLPEGRAMGTTLTMAYVLFPRLYVLHVGDSRCYLQREGKLEQLTKDHTMAQALIDEGVPEKKLEGSPLAHSLLNAIGANSKDAAPEVHKVLLEPNDKLCLCTDGLTREVSDETLAETLASEDPADRLVERLVDRALEEEARDNVTAIVAHFPTTGDCKHDTNAARADTRAEAGGARMTEIVATADVLA